MVNTKCKIKNKEQNLKQENYNVKGKDLSLGLEFQNHWSSNMSGK